MEGSEAPFDLPGNHELISQQGTKVTVMGFWVPSAPLVLSGGYYGDRDRVVVGNLSGEDYVKWK